MPPALDPDHTFAENRQNFNAHIDSATLSGKIKYI
jgi:hypothetical protein